MSVCGHREVAEQARRDAEAIRARIRTAIEAKASAAFYIDNALSQPMLVQRLQSSLACHMEMVRMCMRAHARVLICMRPCRID